MAEPVLRPERLALPSATERLAGAVVGGVAGAILASFASIIPAIGTFGWLPVIVGGVAGVAYGAFRPPRAARVRLRLPEAVAGQPAPIGALGAATVRDLERPTATAMLIGVALGIGAIPLGLAIYAALDVRPSLTVLGFVGVAGFVAALACMAFLPGFLIRGRPRAVLVAHIWLGARELRRALGSPDAARAMPVTPAEVPAWMTTHEETDATREVVVELHLMAGDLAAARETIKRMPISTPRDRFAVALLRAMVDYQGGEPVDEGPVRDALAVMPAGLERVESSLALAAFEARRALPDGDWRESLVAARRLIPEGDLAVLARDFGAVNFRVILRKTWLVLALLVVLTLVLGPSVDAALP